MKTFVLPQCQKAKKWRKSKRGGRIFRFFPNSMFGTRTADNDLNERRQIARDICLGNIRPCGCGPPNFPGFKKFLDPEFDWTKHFGTDLFVNNFNVITHLEIPWLNTY